MPTEQPGSTSVLAAASLIPVLLRRRVLVLVVLGCGALALVCWACAPQWAARAIVTAPNYGRHFAESADTSGSEHGANGVAHKLRVAVGPPKASLLVWVFDPPAQSEPAPLATILFLHGISGNMDQFTGTARAYAQRGYRTIVLDLRGHGRSSGDWVTFGAVESRDLVQVLDALQERGLLAGRLGVYGVSYGAAVGIQLAARDDRVRAVVAISPFSSMREVIPCYARLVPPLCWIYSDADIQSAIDRAGQTAGFDPDEASPLRAIARTSAPMLLVHGRDDRNIPWTHSDVLHKAAAERSRLIVVDGEDHDSLPRDATGILSREATAWIEACLLEPTARP